MALSEAQKLDVRRYAGYPLVSPDPEFVDPAIVNVPGQVRSLGDWLDDLSAEQETVLTDLYLANLTTLETGQLDALENVDASAAGTWKSNPREISERRRMFNQWRRDMCNFIGVDPGPGLGSGGMNLVRG